MLRIVIEPVADEAHRSDEPDGEQRGPLALHRS